MWHIYIVYRVPSRVVRCPFHLPFAIPSTVEQSVCLRLCTFGLLRLVISKWNQITMNGTICACQKTKECDREREREICRWECDGDKSKNKNNVKRKKNSDLFTVCGNEKNNDNRILSYCCLRYTSSIHIRASILIHIRSTRVCVWDMCWLTLPLPKANVWNINFPV